MVKVLCTSLVRLRKFRILLELHLQAWRIEGKWGYSQIREWE